MFSRIKKIRSDLGLIQEVFAKGLEMKQDNYAKIETGKVKPTLKTLIILHNKYGINLNWLICGSGKMKLTESVNTNVVNEPPSDYGLKAAYEAQKELLKYKDEEIARLKECCKMVEVKDKANNH